MWKLTKNIIIEGTDLAGKSTLKKMLQEHLQLPVREERIQRIAEPIQKVAVAFADTTRKDRVVLDRCHFISDIVYEEALGHSPSIFYDCYPAVVQALKDHCLVLFVSVDTSELRARYITRGDDMRSWEEIDKAHTIYEDYFNQAHDFPVLQLNGNIDEHLLAWLTKAMLDAGAIKWVFEEADAGAIQSIMDKTDFEITHLGKRTTVVRATLPNGFIITESSSCLNEKFYDPAYGINTCKSKIREKLWELEAYRLGGEN